MCILCYLVCLNHKWLLARPHTIRTRLTEENSKTLMGIVCSVFFFLFIFGAGCALWDRSQFRGTLQPRMNKEVTDRSLWARFVKQRFLRLLSKGEVSNGLLLTSNVFTACTQQQPQWKLTGVIIITLTATVVQTLFLQPEIPQGKASPPGETQRCNDTKTGVFPPDIQKKLGVLSSLIFRSSECKN